MRSSDVDILMVPGWSGSGPDHWQTRWQAKLSTARRVEQDDWERPERETWAEAIARAVGEATRPVVLVAHSCGVSAVVHAASRFDPARIAGAFLVAPPSEEMTAREPAIASFAPYPMAPLPFPSLVIASRNDPYCSFADAEALAGAWGALVSDAGEAGHINTASGHGPWPEGLMRFAGFLKEIGRIQ
jgi:predicted alpha/beta hydrolase family esterase